MYMFAPYIDMSQYEKHAIVIPVHPVPPGLVLPSPLKPDGHVQVKLPSVFIQVAPFTQSAVPMVHSLMSKIMTTMINFND